MKVIFAGSSAFGIPALSRLLHAEPPVLVVSQPDRAAGRHLHPQSCPVAEYARAQGLPLFQPEDINAPESVVRLRSLEPDLIVTASYGGLLKRVLRQMPRLATLNLHPSLLPLYRGATPIQSALLNGDEVTGVTVFRLQARLDAGPILAQEKMTILPEDNFSSLHDKLAELASWMLAELMPVLAAGKALEQPQDDSLATYTAKLDKDSLNLDWDQPAAQVLNRIRALAMVPGAQTGFRNFPLKILAAELTDQPADNQPGTITGITRNSGFAVNCRDFQLRPETVQPAGKKAMSAQSFLSGARLTPDDRFTNSTWR